MDLKGKSFRFITQEKKEGEMESDTLYFKFGWRCIIVFKRKIVGEGGFRLRES